MAMATVESKLGWKMKNRMKYFYNQQRTSCRKYAVEAAAEHK